MISKIVRIITFGLLINLGINNRVVEKCVLNNENYGVDTCITPRPISIVYAMSFYPFLLLNNISSIPLIYELDQIYLNQSVKQYFTLQLLDVFINNLEYVKPGNDVKLNEYLSTYTTNTINYLSYIRGVYFDPLSVKKYEQRIISLLGAEILDIRTIDFNAPLENSIYKDILNAMEHSHFSEYSVARDLKHIADIELKLYSAAESISLLFENITYIYNREQPTIYLEYLASTEKLEQKKSFISFSIFNVLFFNNNAIEVINKNLPMEDVICDSTLLFYIPCKLDKLEQY